MYANEMRAVTQPQRDARLRNKIHK